MHKYDKPQHNLEKEGWLDCISFWSKWATMKAWHMHLPNLTYGSNQGILSVQPAKSVYIVEWARQCSCHEESNWVTLVA